VSSSIIGWIALAFSAAVRAIAERQAVSAG
jgi:hypothetical protein